MVSIIKNSANQSDSLHWNMQNPWEPDFDTRQAKHDTDYEERAVLHRLTPPPATPPPFLRRGENTVMPTDYVFVF